MSLFKHVSKQVTRPAVGKQHNLSFGVVFLATIGVMQRREDLTITRFVVNVKKVLIVAALNL